MRNIVKTAVAAVVSIGIVGTIPAQAGPGAIGNVATSQKVELVKKGGKGNWHRGRGCCWGGGWGGWGWWGPVAGFGTGLFVASVLATPRYAYYPARPRYVYSNRVAYCDAKFQSYNPRTRLYTGYDGLKHYC